MRCWTVIRTIPATIGSTTITLEPFFSPCSTWFMTSMVSANTTSSTPIAEMATCLLIPSLNLAIPTIRVLARSSLRASTRIVGIARFNEGISRQVAISAIGVELVVFAETMLVMNQVLHGEKNGSKVMVVDPIVAGIVRITVQHLIDGLQVPAIGVLHN